MIRVAEDLAAAGSRGPGAQMDIDGAADVAKLETLG